MRHRCWSYTFDLTDEHLTPNIADPLKHSYDVLGEQAYTKLNDISPSASLPRNISQHTPSKPESNGIPNSKLSSDPQETPNSIPPEKKETEATAPPPVRDLYAIFEAHHSSDPILSKLWTEVHTVPDWVDWPQIARGQDVFYRYGGAALTGLAYQSLLGGMGAARVVETLARTGGFSTKVARRRLFETTQHILQCTRSLEAIQPGGEGWKSSIRVRLLHAAVRQRIMKLADGRPEYYNVKEWGVPINDLDSIATIGTFSATLIWIAFPRQGIFLRKQEIIDYIALWRYIAYVVGTPTDFFATPEKAKAVMESLLYYEVRPSETSKILANNIIKSLAYQPPINASPDMLIASARWLNGHTLCDALALERPSMYYYLLMAGQCMFFMFMSYTCRFIPSWDEWKVHSVRDVYYKIIVESKYGLQGTETMFDFKYVPELSTVTELGDADHSAQLKGIELRNLKWLAFGVLFMMGSTWCMVKVVGWMWRAMF